MANNNTNPVTYAVVENCIRWCNNMLSEILGNYGQHIPPQARIHLKTATLALGEAFQEMRRSP